MFTKRLRLIAVVTGILIVLVALVLKFGVTSTYAGTGWQDSSLDNWRFQYEIDPEDNGDYSLMSNFARASAADIQAAVTAMNQTAAKLADEGTPFKATIVFARPLPVAEFKSFARATGIAPVENYLRGLDANGQRAIIGTPPVWAKDAQGRLQIGKPVPGGDSLDESGLASMTEGPHSVKPLGVIYTEATLDPATYLKVKDDPRVYAIDVMQQVLMDLARQKLPDVPVEKIYVQGGTRLYAAMEETGLAPMPKQP